MTIVRNNKAFWLVFSMALALLNLYALRINLNADSLFPYRYITALFAEHDNMIIVQPGSRIFPEWFYSAIAYQFSTDPMIWSRIIIFINTLLFGLSFLYLFKSMGYNRHQQLVNTVIALLIIPILNLLHLNVFVYFIFSQGLHGFFMPYLIFALALFITWFKQGQITRGSAACFLSIGALCISSNLNFVVAFSIPLSGLLMLLVLFKRVSLVFAIKTLALIIASIIAGLLIMYLLKLLPHFVFLSNDFKFFSISFGQWLQNNILIDKLVDRKVSGFFLEIFALSQLLSIITLYRYYRQQVSPLFLLNIIHLMWPPLLVFTLWSVNQYATRWMPYLFVFSPLLLVLNVVQFFKNRVRYDLLLLGTLALALTSVVMFSDPKRPYIQHQNIEDTLLALKKSGQTTGAGLSDYWISNALNHNDLVLLPIDQHANGYLFASDANRFWQWNQGRKTPHFIDHVINRKNTGAKDWVVDEASLITAFGQWDATVEKTIGNKMYKIYGYPNGIDSTAFYAHIEQKLTALKNK